MHLTVMKAQEYHKRLWNLVMKKDIIAFLAPFFNHWRTSMIWSCGVEDWSQSHLTQGDGASAPNLSRSSSLAMTKERKSTELYLK